MASPSPEPIEPAPRLHGDEGTAVVEAAFVTLPLFLLLLAILEFGLLFKDYLTLSNGLRAGIRTGTVQGSLVYADYEIIQAVKSETFAIPAKNIKRLVVFKANPPSAGQQPLSAPPTNCTTSAIPVHGTNALFCNVYDATNDWNPSPPAGVGKTAADNYNCVDKNWASNWCPTSRFSAAGPPPVTVPPSPLPIQGPPDYIGIYMEVSHPMLSGNLFGSQQRTLTGTSVSRIEPKTSV